MREGGDSGRKRRPRDTRPKSLVGKRASLIPRKLTPRERMPPLQRRVAAQADADPEPSTARGSQAGDASAVVAERVRANVKPEAVADRVYEMLRREMKLDRERAGWR
jgi:hypothetical protein